MEDCKELRFCGYFEVSSVTGEGVNTAFEAILLAVAAKLRS